MANRRKQTRSATGPAAPTRQQLLIAGVVLLLATLLTYGHIASHDFVRFDDSYHLQGNTHLNPLTWSGLGQLWAGPFFGEYVPATYTLFAAESLLSGRIDADAETAAFSPTVFHTGSLLLHLGCVWLALLLLQRLSRHTWAGLCGALLFSLHPLQVESVAWVSETRGLLAGLFSLLSLNAYLTFVGIPGNFTALADEDKSDPPAGTVIARYRWLSYAWATAWLVLALLSKPSAVALPLLAGVLDMAFAKRGWRATSMSLTPWLLLAGGFALWTRSMQPDKVLTFVSPVWARPFIAGDALAFYLQKLVWPASLGIHYPHSPEVLLEGHSLYWMWLLPMACLAIVCAVPAARKYWPAVALFVAVVSPVLGFVPFGFQNYSTVADRYAYLAMLGPALAVTWLLANRWSAARVAVAAALLVILAYLNYEQARTWRDSDALFERAIDVNPKSWLAYMNRGVMRRDDAEKSLAVGNKAHAERQLAAALDDFNKAIEYHPRRFYPTAYMNRASVYWLRGDRQQAMADYTESIRLFPDNPMAYFNRGLAHQELREYPQAVEDYSKTIELQPEFADAFNNRAVVQELLHYQDAALEDYSRFIELRPFNVNGYLLRAHLLREQGRTAEAVEDLSRAIELQPTVAVIEARALFNLSLGKISLARDDLDKIAQLGGRPNPALMREVQARETPAP